jgi:aspartyl protease family protein
MLLLILSLAALLADPPELPSDAVGVLETAGFRVTAERLSHTDEPALARKLRDIAKLKRDLQERRRSIANLDQGQAQTRQLITALRQQQLQLNIQLANVAPGDVTGNNRTVAAINAINQQGELLSEQLRQAEQQRSKERTALIGAEDQYLESIAESQAMADSIQQAYESLSSDETRKSAVLDLWEATDHRFSAAPTGALKRQFESLRKLAAALISEKIQGRAEGNTLIVPVKLVDADEPVEMVVDSGASLISLPANIADAAGISIPADADEVVLSLADGRRIPARLVTLQRVRVGPFEARDVEAVILSPEAGDAPPLLGMSFLGRYNFRINAADKSLSLVDVATEPSK